MAKKIVWTKANPALYRKSPIFQNSANQLLGLSRQRLSNTVARGPAFNIGGDLQAARGGDPYGGLIGGMPDLSALEAQYGAMDRDAAAARDAAIRRLVVSYGAPPDFANMAISDQARGFLKNALDAKTLELAQNAEKEGVSVHARQAKDDMVSRRRIPAILAGRGLLRSGQTVSDLSDQAQTYKNLQYDTLNELLGNVEGTVGAYIQGKRDRELALAQARIQAAWDAQGAWGDYPNIDDPVATGPSGAGRSPAAGVVQRPGRGGYPLTRTGPLSRQNPVRQRNYLNARLRAGRM